MSYTSGFFDAMDLGGGKYDREYSAAVFAHYFSLLVKNGVFPDPSTGMQVKASSSPDMHVSVQPGSGWVNGYYITISDDGPEVLTVPTANPSLSRIDSVIMGLNYVDREIQLYIKSGAVSSSPSAVSLQRDNNLYEMELAQIAVGAGIASISQANITDMRQNTSRCGIVKGTIDQIDTTDLFAQYDDAFQTWFDDIQSQLSGDVATNLQNQINSLKTGKVNVSDKASTEQAQAGTDNTKWMTPALVKASLNDYNKKFYKVGDIVVTARTDLGSDWALCNGASFTSSQYPELAKVMGGLNPEKMEFKGGFNSGMSRGVFGTPPAFNNNGDFICASDDGSYKYATIFKRNQTGELNRILAKPFESGTFAQYCFAAKNNYFYVVCLDKSSGTNPFIYRLDSNGNQLNRTALTTSIKNPSKVCILNNTMIILDNGSNAFYYNKSDPYLGNYARLSISGPNRIYHIFEYMGKFYFLTDTGTYSISNTISGSFTKENDIAAEYAVVNPSNGAIIYFVAYGSNSAKIATSINSASTQNITLNDVYYGERAIVYNNYCYYYSLVGGHLNLNKRDFTYSTNGFRIFKTQNFSNTTVGGSTNYILTNDLIAYVGISTSNQSSAYGVLGLFLPSISFTGAYAYIRVKASI